MIPEPAAIAAYVLVDVGSSVVVNRPAGVITSSASPTFRVSTTPSLKTPPGSFFTPIRSSPELGVVQIEKLRRSPSSPRIVRCCPWTKR